MNKIVQRLFAGLAALVIGVLSLTTSAPMSASAHASMMMDSAVNSNNAVHGSHKIQKALSTYHIDKAQSLSSGVSCASLCQVSTENRSDLTLPSAEKEEDDVYDEQIEGRFLIHPCIKKASQSNFPFRQLKVPLYLKHCSLIL